MDVSTKSLHFGLRDPCRRKCREVLRARADGEHQENMNSERPWQHAQGLHMVPMLTSRHELLFLTKNLSPINNCLKRKNPFPMESPWVHKPHWRAGSMLSSRWSVQNEHKDLWIFFLYCFILDFLYCIFKTLLVICLHVMVSDFEFLWVLFVCLCVCLCMHSLFLISFLLLACSFCFILIFGLFLLTCLSS